MTEIIVTQFSDSEELDQLNRWCKNDRNAVVFLRSIAEASQIADDYADGDAVGSEEMTRLLHLCLVEIPTNQFYITNQNWLTPIMFSSMHLWNASNEWKNEFGYVYRECLEQIIHVVALICGGQKHALNVTKEVNKFYHQDHGEKYQEWLKELN